MAEPLLVPPPVGSGLVFVTGAGGFLGSHAVNAYLAAGWKVAGFALRDRPMAATSALTWICGAVTSSALQDAARRLGRPELIVHTAGGSSVGASLADPHGDLERTVGSIGHVLDFMREGGAGRLLFLSSAAVYGAVDQPAIDEAAQRRPISPYGVHKVAAEDLVQGWASIYGFQACIVRFFSIYGPGLRKQLLWDLANRACRDDHLELSGAGDEARDFLHVDDAVRLIGLLGGLAVDQLPRVVNGGSGEACTVRTLAEGLLQALEVTPSLSFNGVVREGDPRSLVAGSNQFDQIGFRPTVTLSEGLATYSRWFKGL